LPVLIINPYQISVASHTIIFTHGILPMHHF
jgi:hypothetical protein